MFGWFKKNWVVCPICKGSTYYQDLNDHISLCPEILRLTGFEKGMAGLPINAVREIGLGLANPIKTPVGYLSANADNPCIFCSATSFRRHDENCPFYLKHDSQGHWITGTAAHVQPPYVKRGAASKHRSGEAVWDVNSSNPIKLVDSGSGFELRCLECGLLTPHHMSFCKYFEDGCSECGLLTPHHTSFCKYYDEALKAPRFSTKPTVSDINDALKIERCVNCNHVNPTHASECSKPGITYTVGDLPKSLHPYEAWDLKRLQAENERLSSEIKSKEWPSDSEEVRQTSSTGGQKGTKPEAYSLVPTEPIAALSRLMGKGAVKYEAHNWRKGYPASQSYDALVRHLHAWWSGEDNDPEMEESHLAAVMFHCCVLMELKEKHPEMDDRYVPAKKTTDDLISDPFDTQDEFEKWWQSHLKTAVDLYQEDLAKDIYNRNLAWLAHNG